MINNFKKQVLVYEMSAGKDYWHKSKLRRFLINHVFNGVFIERSTPPELILTNKQYLTWINEAIETTWNRNTSIELNAYIQTTISSHREVNAIKFSHLYSPHNTFTLYLNSHTLSIGTGGFVINSKDHIDIIKGVLTSYSGLINIYGEYQGGNAFDIRVPITDHGNTKVGLSIYAAPNANQTVELVGAEHNTFTGNSYISGATELNLVKGDGITAVSGNIHIIDGAAINIFEDEQIANHVRVSLIATNGTSSSIRFNGEFEASLEETLHELVVSGSGVLDFEYENSIYPSLGHGERRFYIDDLIIEENSTLQILGWADQRDFLLVRKDSAHLGDALKKLHFEGYNPNNIHLEDYDGQYSAISAAPEPATYGALLSPLGIGLVAWRKRRLRRSSVK